MLYLNEKDIEKIGVDWNKCTETIKKAVFCLDTHNAVQPIKPYLRFKNPINRIIAMPAYLGDGFDIAGIKWIASFPENIKRGIPRASSIEILNDPDTGKIISVINASSLSIIRTASVSALMIKYFLEARNLEKITVGIIGWGPVGQYHAKMCQEMFGDKISKMFLYDIKKIGSIDINSIKNTVIENSWKNVYTKSDILITCTVSADRYIDVKPKRGSLLLNVSLRDYKSHIFPFVKKSIVVDNWSEVCREGTDIELFHKLNGLEERDTKSISDVVVREALKSYPKTGPIMFNPMGMAIFDIAIAKYFLEQAKKKKIGLILQ
ncbi:MAG: 2,3-diaminopropionate biosynthesis protein SbnB [Candidatus Paceibacterota bacterium]